ncbi:hypothetical protein V6N11_022781 [Hibiscus sabdariffa]|uniref:Uncharacterized protein n=1 Tax=Hibiscus sabdariffa TaxID=183260 RepID=A0ABR2TKZ6_9ROSI
MYKGRMVFDLCGQLPLVSYPMILLDLLALSVMSGKLGVNQAFKLYSEIFEIWLVPMLGLKDCLLSKSFNAEDGNFVQHSKKQ